MAPTIEELAPKIEEKRIANEKEVTMELEQEKWRKRTEEVIDYMNTRWDYEMRKEERLRSDSSKERVRPYLNTFSRFLGRMQKDKDFREAAGLLVPCSIVRIEESASSIYPAIAAYITMENFKSSFPSFFDKYFNGNGSEICSPTEIESLEEWDPYSGEFVLLKKSNSEINETFVVVNIPIRGSRIWNGLFEVIDYIK